MPLSVYLVSSAAQGIGLAIAQRLLADGAAVALVERDKAALHALNALRSRCRDDLLLHGDVTDETSVKNCVAKTLHTYAGLHGLVNNAAIAAPATGPIAELALAQWQKYLAANLTGPMLLAKHCVAHLQASGGAIVNIASTRALQSEPHTEAYAAAKGGLVSLTHALAVSLAGKVRVNSVSPGWIVTDSFNKTQPPTRLSEEDHRQHPTGRESQPQDVAEVVAFLLAQKSAFITAQNFVVDGGMSKKMVYV